MNRFVNKWLKKDEGTSLIELLAVLTILALVMGTIYGVITFGYTSYNKVTVENELRDEADIVMSTIMTELYTVGPTTIESKVGANGITLTRKDVIDSQTSYSEIYFDPVQTGVINQLRLGNPNQIPSGVKALELAADLSGSTIQLECGSIVQCHNGLIVVDLHLMQKDKKGVAHTLNLKSRFGF